MCLVGSVAWARDRMEGTLLDGGCHQFAIIRWEGPQVGGDFAEDGRLVST